MDMSLEPYVIASALIGVVAQRLVRRLCGACRRQYTPDPETLRSLNITEADAAQLRVLQAPSAATSATTPATAAASRIYEVMRVNDKIRRLIAQNAGEDLVREAAVESGMITLGEDGARQGQGGRDHRRGAAARRDRGARAAHALPGLPAAAVAMDFMACPHCGFTV